MKITDYPEATSLASDDSFIIDGPTNGTRHLPQKNLSLGGGSVPATDPAWVSHRNTYRGQNLGSVYTDEQKAMVAANTFDDLYVGDYWTIGGTDWIIADINYWLGIGDQPEHEGCTTPHLVVIPKKTLYTTKMNDTNTSTGAYLGSKMYTTNLNQAKTIIYTAFGENNILDHRSLFVNGVSSSGVPISGLFVDSKVDLMNQIMVYGSRMIFVSAGVGNGPYFYTSDKTILSLFKLRPELIIVPEETYWLRDTVGGTLFAIVNYLGFGHDGNASGTFGVRPAFGLTGGTN